ncbi:MAG: xanthine dehydrogenase family protein molybdopterin-binding subunit [Oligoflexales bacterium]|nr:xanthine dehydrogenase family protein molybdopterin-binding subunit [Oligoflexales bacterium]
MATNRRDFLKVSVGLGGVLASASSLSLTGCSTTHQVDVGAKKSKLSFWIEAQTKGQGLTFICSQCEMGQGVAHSLPMMFCEEFEYPPEQLEIQFAPVGAEYKNPAFSMQSTGGSTSVTAYFEPMRRAGAACRQVLIKAAAKHWDIPEDQCIAENGFVLQKGKPKVKESYPNLIAKADGLSASESVKLKDPRDFKLIGKRRPRIDNKPKLAAKAVYGIDAPPPDALKATVIHAPIPGAKGSVKNLESMKKELGIQGIFAFDFGVVVVAKKYWQAKRLAEKLEISWKNASSKFDSEQQTQSYQEACSKAYYEEYAESIAQLANDGHKTIEHEYQVPYLAHACMEPMNATVLVKEDGCVVWAPTQAASLTQEAVAKVCDVPYDKVTVHSTYCGGGFGRRFYQNYSEEAAQVAKQFPGKPVQLLWSREEDTHNDFYRPNGVAKMGGAVDARSGKILAWYHVHASPSFSSDVFSRFSHGIFPEWLGRSFKNSLGSGLGSLISGAMENEGSDAIPYLSDEFDFHWKEVPTELKLGFWRSVGHSISGFYKESFVDELAYLADQDPITFRLSNLDSEKPRYKKVLERLAAHPLWVQRKPGDGVGVAVHESFKSYVGELVKVSMKGNQISVDEAFVVVDCGLAVDPDGVKAQMEGGLIYGLSAALFGEITIQEGRVVQSNFHDFRVLRMSEAPNIDVDIITDPNVELGGCGEPATPPIAAAVANAVYDLSKKRLRSLPLQKAWDQLA